MTTTVGRVVHLPASSGARDHVRADQPGSSGWFQIAASNATHMARENGLRTLWEDPGSVLVYADLGATDVVSTFQWHGEDSAGVYARRAGTYRVRPYGEAGSVPRVHLACRGEAPTGYKLGVVLLVVRGEGPPDFFGAATGSTTTLSTTTVDLTVTVALYPASAGPVDIETPDESEGGVLPVVTVYVGAWCTSASALAKASLYGVTISLLPP